MPYTTKPRPYKKEWEDQQARGQTERDRRAARERARYTLDKQGVDRAGKDIDHKVPLSKGGSATAPKNLRLVAPSTNRSFSRNANHTVKRNAPKK